MKNILVFGGGGFIGKNLVGKLLENPENKVVVFDIAFGENDNENLKKYKGSIFNPEDIERVLETEKFEYIYYLISTTFPKSSWDNPLKEVHENLVPFMNLLSKACSLPIKKLIFLSSGGTVYGLKTGYLNEDQPKTPFSPYGIFKSTMEQMLEYHHRKDNLNFDIYRISNVYGPGQNTSLGLGVINTWLEKIIRQEAITIFGDGTNVRDYLYIEDLAKILSFSIAQPNDSPRILNAGTGKGASLNNVLDIVRRIVEEQVQINYSEARDSDNKFVILDNTRLMEAFKLDHSYFISLEDGIRKTYSYLKSVEGTK